MRKSAPAIVAVLVALQAVSASATAIYEYTGNLFDTIIDEGPGGTYTTSMRVTGSITLAEPLAPNLPPGTDILGLVLDATFNDGRLTRTLANSPGGVLSDTPLIEVGTDASGNITSWGVGLAIETLLSPYLFVTAIQTFPDLDAGIIGLVANCSAGCQVETPGDQGSVSGNPGTWTLIPEPSTALLFASGLLGLGLRRRRR